MKRKLSWLKARKLQKLGFFKLPKANHQWVGTPYKWGRILEDRRVMAYTEEHLATYPIHELMNMMFFYSTPSGEEMLADEKVVKIF